MKNNKKQKIWIAFKKKKLYQRTTYQAPLGCLSEILKKKYFQSYTNSFGKYKREKK